MNHATQNVTFQEPNHLMLYLEDEKGYTYWVRVQAGRKFATALKDAYAESRCCPEAKAVDGGGYAVTLRGVTQWFSDDDFVLFTRHRMYVKFNCIEGPGLDVLELEDLDENWFEEQTTSKVLPDVPWSEGPDTAGATPSTLRG